MIKTISKIMGSEVIKTSKVKNKEFVKFENEIELRLTTENNELKQVGLVLNSGKNIFITNTENVEKVINTIEQYITLWGLKAQTSTQTQQVEAPQELNTIEYDINYILSDKMDFSKVEENQIRDLMIDGLELNYLLTLNSKQLDELFCQYND